MSSWVFHPVCHHSHASLVLEVGGGRLFLLSFILAYNSCSYLEKWGSLLAWMDGLSCAQWHPKTEECFKQPIFPVQSLLIWGHSYELQWMKQIFEALVKEKIYKGHFLLKSTYSISKKPHCITQSMWQHHHKSSRPITRESSESQVAIFPAEIREAEHGASKECKAVREETGGRQRKEVPSEIRGWPCHTTSKKEGPSSASLHWSRAAWL